MYKKLSISVLNALILEVKVTRSCFLSISLGLLLALSSLSSMAEARQAPEITCDGISSIADPSAPEYLMRAEPFQVTFALKKDDIFKGTGSVAISQSLQLNINVEAGVVSSDWIRVSLDATNTASGNFESIGPSFQEELKAKNGVPFLLERTGLENSFLYSRIKQNLKSAALPDFSLKKLINQGLIVDGDTLSFILNKCVIQGR